MRTRPLPDPKVQRNGHPTICLSTSDWKPGDFACYDRADRHIEPYLGKRIRVTQHLRKRKRYAAGQCPNCGYDLRATPDRGPECGTRTSKASDVKPV